MAARPTQEPPTPRSVASQTEARTEPAAPAPMLVTRSASAASASAASTATAMTAPVQIVVTPAESSQPSEARASRSHPVKLRRPSPARPYHERMLRLSPAFGDAASSREPVFTAVKGPSMMTTATASTAVTAATRVQTVGCVKTIISIENVRAATNSEETVQTLARRVAVKSQPTLAAVVGRRRSDRERYGHDRTLRRFRNGSSTCTACVAVAQLSAIVIG